MSHAAYAKLTARCKELGDLRSVAALAAWDQETQLPPGGVNARAEQMALLSGMMHERMTSKEMGDLIGECSNNGFAPDSVEAANVRELKRDHARASKLPKEHVEELARERSISQHVWADARKKNDFKSFAPNLKRMFELTRKSASYYGWPSDGEPYDALLENYEPGARSKEVEAIFKPLQARLTALISEVKGSKKKISDAVHKALVPREQQEAFARFVAERIGFDFNSGRLDVSTHPFCETVSPGDVRLTTRFHKDQALEALSSTMHEAGHGMYEQGLKHEQYGLPCGEAVSLGVHESQSRGWENMVGRSLPFWKWATPHARKLMPKAMKGQNAEKMFAASNIVQPSYIRVESDETTYNLHIMLRFDLERALLKGDLKTDDVPGVWNETFEKYMGLKVKKDAQGCLQDVHWSAGLIGYFPTYALGNLYAAQFFAAARKAMPGMDKDFAKGKFQPLLTWLNKNIHQHGRRYPARELCRRVTGKDLSSEAFLAYLEGKIRPLYGI